MSLDLSEEIHKMYLIMIPQFKLAEYQNKIKEFSKLSKKLGVVDALKKIVEIKEEYEKILCLANKSGYTLKFLPRQLNYLEVQN